METRSVAPLSFGLGQVFHNGFGENSQAIREFCPHGLTALVFSDPKGRELLAEALCVAALQAG